MESSRQEYWSGLPFPSPGDLPNPGIKPGSPALQAEYLLSEPPGKPHIVNKTPLLENMCLLFHPSSSGGSCGEGQSPRQVQYGPGALEAQSPSAPAVCELRKGLCRRGVSGDGGRVPARRFKRVRRRREGCFRQRKPLL